MNKSQDSEDVRQHAISLFTFLHELAQLKTKKMRDLRDFEQVLWLRDIPDEPECYCACGHVDGDGQSDGVWLEIQKPKRKNAPDLPKEIRPWLKMEEVGDSSVKEPSVNDQIVLPSEETGSGEQEFRYLKDFPQIRIQCNSYIETKWKPWAEDDRKRRTVQEIYTRLFSMHQNQQTLGEQYELVLGLGHLTWETDNYTINRHLLIAQASIEFEASRGIITVGMPSEGAKPSLEEDILDPADRPNTQVVQGLADKIRDLEGQLWDNVSVSNVLNSWLNSISSHSRYSDSLEPLGQKDENPKINLAPALILRKRTERSLLAAYDEILKQLETEDVIPRGITNIVTVSDNIDEEGERSPGKLVDELLFPLPANDEQKKIIDKLRFQNGVLVQGPPGTGKSHTIANLICHLLAHGKRVLVTSHTARALQVLSSKIPPELSGLCVNLLGNDREALRGLEKSVQTITAIYNNWDPKANDSEIKKLEKELDSVRRDEAKCLNDLRAVREKETYKHTLAWGDYAGTAKSIAERLRKEENLYKWLSEIPKKKSPSISNDEAVELLALLRKHENTESALSPKAFDFVSDLPPVLEYTAAVVDFIDAKKRLDEAKEFNSNDIPLIKADSAVLESLSLGLDNLLKTIQKLVQNSETWAKDATFDVLAGKGGSWQELHSSTEKHLDALTSAADRVSDIAVRGLGNRDLYSTRADAEALRKHLDNGGNLGWWMFRPKIVKQASYLYDEVQINGEACLTSRNLEKLIDWLNVTLRMDRLDHHWQDITEVSAHSLSMRTREYQDLLVPLGEALSLDGVIKDLQTHLQNVSGVSEPAWHQSEDIQKLQKAVQYSLSANSYQQAEAKLRSLERKIKTAAFPENHPVVKEIQGAIQRRDPKAYQEARDKVLELKKVNGLFAKMRDVLPRTASELLSSYQLPEWKDRLSKLDSAFNWKLTDKWFEDFSMPGYEECLRRALERARDEKLRIICRLAETFAWKYCFSRMSNNERQHLVMWSKEMKLVGKGTGKYAALHRRQAREHMKQCSSAIPAWVMPLYKVAESVNIDKEVFDVVIVDEASQSGPEASLLMYLAKKVIVVGDDKQISPENVGVNRENVIQLQQRYLKDIELNNIFSLDSSFFAIAEVRFGGRIRLREHFRCMPEIIQFSNNLCYESEPLIPLRQYGAARLDPVVTRYVQEGYSKGRTKVVNPPEAEAIVNQIIECCKDRQYSDKSIGVISLQGDAQARQIEGLLLDRLGPEEMEQRSLVCGDAYAFQGDERDIIFLSLVASPNGDGQRIGTLSRQQDIRRFNVAVSRARDQIWLFHSATVNDLSPKCLRRSLLEYCKDPHISNPDPPIGIDLWKLNKIAHDADRQREKPPIPFESWFEVDVLLKIANRGYRVIPQYESAGYRIDIVVEGMEGRLAVECDGDEWHGAEQYEADTVRQTLLERCGWTFWRVRDSVFARDNEAALAGLWEKLDELGIKPGSEKGQDESETGTEEYEEETPTPVSGDDDEEEEEGKKMGGDQQPKGLEEPQEPLGPRKKSEPPESPQPPAQTTDFEAGDEVYHNRFGRGTIIEAVGPAGKMKVIVKFAIGTKKLSLEYAKLRKVPKQGKFFDLDDSESDELPLFRNAD